MSSHHRFWPHGSIPVLDAFQAKEFAQLGVIAKSFPNNRHTERFKFHTFLQPKPPAVQACLGCF